MKNNTTTYYLNDLQRDNQFIPVTLLEAQSFLHDLWIDEEYWCQVFESEKEFDKWLKEIWVSDWKEIDDRLQGCEYTIYTEDEFKTAKQLFDDIEIVEYFD